jgi:VWFA-related protein
MKLPSALAFILMISSLAPVFGQTARPAAAPPASPSAQQPSAEDEVVRITTNLVQIDAVVTDKKGNHVADLTADDFEILEDGRPQQITNFTYVPDDAPGPRPPASKEAPADKNGPPAPPVRLRPEQVRRTLAVVIDDLGLSFESTAYVREALKKFVNQQVQPGDLVAIIRTSGGIGALQQFTADKRQLNAAIERVRWYPLGRGQIGAFAPITSDPLAQTNPVAASRRGNGSGEQSLDEFREEIFSVGTLGAINYVVRGMRELPGRKSVLLVSDGLRIFNRDQDSPRVLDAMRRLTDLANRSSVVIYTMDARGLQTLMPTAADDLSGMSPDQITETLSRRRQDFYESQSGLNYLAQQTGGFFVGNTNDLGGGIRRVLEDQRGYYLIGYRPDDSTFDASGKRQLFHKISVKVKRPGLRVRSRSGFINITDEKANPVRRTRRDQIMAALTSPFSSGEIPLRLTSIFINDQKSGPLMHSMLHIDVSNFTFTEEADGWHKAVFDVVAVTFGDNGQVIDQADRIYTVKLRGDTYQRQKRDGLVYRINVPIKKAGAYQLRTVVRDTASARVGSASQFIEVPDIKKDRLTLSGIMMRGVEANAATQPAGATAENPAGAAEGASDEANAQASPAVRRLRPGMYMEYGCAIYNAQVDRATHRPQLQAQIRLFRDGKQIYASPLAPVSLGGEQDPKNLSVGGRMRLSPNAAPGEYVLQIVVADALAKEKYRTAAQWMDFEIVK